MLSFNRLEDIENNKSYTEINYTEAKIRAFTRELGGKFLAYLFFGRDKKAILWSYDSAETRNSGIQSTVEKHIHVLAQKAKDRTERNSAPRGLEVGDILSSSWGHEQTNVDFYQVVELAGKSSVIVRKISSYLTDEAVGPMSGYRMPVPGDLIGEPFKKLAKNGSFALTSYASADFWGTANKPGRAMYSSWYG